MSDVTIPLAFLAGILSFLSPCILPLLPAFISYLSGISLVEVKKNPAHARSAIFLNALSFVLGFAIVFSLLGILLNAVLGGLAYDTRIWLSRIGGIIIIIFGLSLTGVLNLGILNREHKIRPPKMGGSYVTSFLFGLAFAAGWTPCVGPVLGSILTFAALAPGAAFGLLFAYSLGLGIPFLVVGAFTSRATGVIQRLQPRLRLFQIAMGILLIFLGILVLTGNINLLASFLPVDVMLS